tara:strand:- start:459 stop:698 length:240 start_codon:yes stop_codon:yes gene_type:complete
MLSSIRSEERLEEVMAAACDDGIGIIARWMRREDDGWNVDAMDTESDQGMRRVTDFGDEEPVPHAPPESLFPANITHIP